MRAEPSGWPTKASRTAGSQLTISRPAVGGVLTARVCRRRRRGGGGGNCLDSGRAAQIERDHRVTLPAVQEADDIGHYERARDRADQRRPNRRAGDLQDPATCGALVSADLDLPGDLAFVRITERPRGSHVVREQTPGPPRRARCEAPCRGTRLGPPRDRRRRCGRRRPVPGDRRGSMSSNPASAVIGSLRSRSPWDIGWKCLSKARSTMRVRKPRQSTAAATIRVLRLPTSAAVTSSCAAMLPSTSNVVPILLLL